MSECNYRVWVEQAGWLTFPTDRLGVEWIAKRWESLQQEKLTLEERGGVLEAYNEERERRVLAKPDADEALRRKDKESGMVAFPMGMTGRFMSMNKISILYPSFEKEVKIEIGSNASVILGLDDLEMCDRLRVVRIGKGPKIDEITTDENGIRNLISEITDRLSGSWDLSQNEKAALRRAEKKLTEAL